MKNQENLGQENLGQVEVRGPVPSLYFLCLCLSRWYYHPLLQNLFYMKPESSSACNDEPHSSFQKNNEEELGSGIYINRDT